MNEKERLQEERKLLLQEVEALLSMIAAPVLVIDQNGAILHVNTLAEQAWRRSQITLTNKQIAELIDQEDILTYLKQGKPTKNLPVQIKDSTGGHHPYRCRLHPLFVNQKVAGAVLQLMKQEPIPEQGADRRYRVRYTFHDIRGSSEVLTSLLAEAEKVAKSDSTILVRGESGTGKEVLAQAIHHASLRSDGPFLALNCAAIPESLLESELFGYEEGAFTGAKKGGKMGRFELARGGTLFLDEVGDMPLHLQAKLLRVLQERRIERVGGSGSIPIDVRVIAATHKDLEAMIARQKFREDLYYRLNVIPLVMPPLRERKADLYDLIHYFMKKFSVRLDKEIKRFSSQALQCLYDYHWPGNVRELENVAEYIMNLEIGELVTVTSLPAYMRNAPARGAEPDFPVIKRTEVPETTYLNFDEAEKKLLFEALKRFGMSTEGKRKAAEALGISVSTLYRKLQRIRRENKLSR
ncbi:sigma-54 interaction domain-containing protein [Brevibacillus massiliensis]|jgi:transcriptional regulator with PAS, ATPase and Fis domain|uniref:sigma-54 interaction domain-containing protein n=1 Tax=Brevibacillus massiliensis TaxID=1118054 RepID=UPI0002D43D3D|nr:sigma-54-dependent Fis family transcriptional regulator [Brevibacillus massiliensis]